jgi:hypothetical protein
MPPAVLARESLPHDVQSRKTEAGEMLEKFPRDITISAPRCSNDKYVSVRSENYAGSAGS